MYLFKGLTKSFCCFPTPLGLKILGFYSFDIFTVRGRKQLKYFFFWSLIFFFFEVEDIVKACRERGKKGKSHPRIIHLLTFNMAVLDVDNFQKQNWNINSQFNTKFLLGQLFNNLPFKRWSLQPLVPNPANFEVTTKEPLHYKWEENIALPIFIAHELPETKPWAQTRAFNSHPWSRHPRNSMGLEAKNQASFAQRDGLAWQSHPWLSHWLIQEFRPSAAESH